MPKSLDVYINGQLIGYLHDHEPLTFTYTNECISGLVSSPIEKIIPLETGEINSPAVHAYFENLLPEGDQRDSLEKKYHVTSIFGLLENSAWDSAGSLVLIPTGTAPHDPEYVKTTWPEIAQIISGQLERHDRPKTTISGAQYKILLSIDKTDSHPLLPVGSTPSSHILKPDIQRPGQKIWASAVNEAIMMRLSSKCGLQTASVDYISEVKSCLVKRYDRVESVNGITRINQFDICQLLKIPSGVKYELDGGPSFAQSYEQVKSLSINPINDCESLLKWLFFNLFIGNNDSHAKNLSVLVTDKGYCLAPFYDLMCTSVYSGFSNNFAFKIGDTYKPGEVTGSQLVTLASSIKVSDKFLLKLAKEMSEKIISSLPIVLDELQPQFSHQEKVMAERLGYEVSTICKNRMAKLFQK